MALPVLTTAEDVTALIGYLKTKPTGATIAEAKAAINKSVLDPRKFTAYTLWGFVNKEGERVKLTERGWEFARKPEAQSEIYRRVIDSIPPYKSVLEWAFHQKMDAITNVDVAAHWHEHHKEALGGWPILAHFARVGFPLLMAAGDRDTAVGCSFRF